MADRYPAGKQYECLRCQSKWQSRIAGKPKACARCKSFYYDKPPKKIAHSSRGMGAEAK